MMQVEKKKRTHSGSRSKSKKHRGHEYSVELRAKHLGDMTKIKTENSSSLHKSRPSRKNSSKPAKKHTKSNNRESKDPGSHSVSADRRYSVIKVNRTQANLDSEQFELAVDQLLMGMRSIPQPPCLNARLIGQYFNDLKRFYSTLDGPFQRLCSEIHSFYLNPLTSFLELVTPMQDAIRRKEQIAKEIDRQIIQNQSLYEQLQPIDIEIFKLKEKIQQNRVLIEQKRQQKQEKQKQKVGQANGQANPFTKEKEPPRQPRQAPSSGTMGFKLDLQGINRAGQMDYHEQFYSKIDEFSESWRNQALKQKRY